MISINDAWPVQTVSQFRCRLLSLHGPLPIGRKTGAFEEFECVAQYAPVPFAGAPENWALRLFAGQVAMPGR